MDWFDWILMLVLALHCGLAIGRILDKQNIRSAIASTILYGLLTTGIIILS